MKTIDISTTNAALSALIDTVIDGEEITLTRSGTPIARILPISSGGRRSPEEIRRAVDEWFAFRSEHNITLGGLSIRDLIEEGRR